MRNKAKMYCACGVVLVVLGIILIVADRSRLFAYGAIALGMCSYALAKREKKSNTDGHKSDDSASNNSTNNSSKE